MKNAKDKHITPVGTNRVVHAPSDKKCAAQADTTNLAIGASSHRITHASSDKKCVACFNVAGSSSVQDCPQVSNIIGMFMNSFLYTEAKHFDSYLE